MFRAALSVPLAVVVGMATAIQVRDRFGEISLSIEGLKTPPAPVYVTIWFDLSRDRLTLLAPEPVRSARPVVRLMLPPDAEIDTRRDLVTLGADQLTATRCLLASLVGEPSGVRLAQGTQPACVWAASPRPPADPVTHPGGPGHERGRMPLPLIVQYRESDDRFVLGVSRSDVGGAGSLLLDAPASAHFHDEDDSLTLDGAPWTATQCVISAVRGGPIRLVVGSDHPRSTHPE
jgi:hypothetical protein